MKRGRLKSPVMYSSTLKPSGTARLASEGRSTTFGRLVADSVWNGSGRPFQLTGLFGSAAASAASNTAEMQRVIQMRMPYSVADSRPVGAHVRVWDCFGQRGTATSFVRRSLGWFGRSGAFVAGSQAAISRFTSA